MIKRILFYTLTAAVLLSASSCKNNALAPRPHTLDKGYAQHEGKIGETDQNKFSMILTNMEFNEDHSVILGPGETIYLDLATPLAVSLESIPSGRYTFSTESKEHTILDSENSRFIIIDKDGKQTSARISHGNININKYGNKYIINGLVSDSKGTIFEFTYSNDIEFKQKIHMINGISIYNKHASPTVDLFDLMLTDMVLDGSNNPIGPGRLISLQIYTPTSENNYLPEGTYTFSESTDITAGIILGNNVSFMQFLDDKNEGGRMYLIDGEVTVKKSGDKYTIAGKVTSLNGTIQFEYVGTPIHVG